MKSSFALSLSPFEKVILPVYWYWEHEELQDLNVSGLYNFMKISKLSDSCFQFWQISMLLSTRLKNDFNLAERQDTSS